MAFPFHFRSCSFSTIKWQTEVVYAIIWRRGRFFSSKYRTSNTCLYLYTNWFRLNPKPTFTEVWFRPVIVIDDGDKENNRYFLKEAGWGECIQEGLFYYVEPYRYVIFVNQKSLNIDSFLWFNLILYWH